MRVAWLNWWQKAGDADCGRAAVSPQAPALRKGSAAEELAAGFLRREGLSVLEHNARFRGGEIDLRQLGGLLHQRRRDSAAGMIQLRLDDDAAR